MMDVSSFSALIGGLLTFFAPCTLPLIPAYIAFINSSHHVGDGARRRLFLNAVFFIFGFTFVFMLYGVSSGALGTYLILYRKLIAQVGGIVVMLFGLSMLGMLRLPTFLHHPLGKVPLWIKRGTPLGSFLLGFFFAFGWSPCLGPILGTILVLASSGGSALYGGYLLFVYSLGLAIPFLVVAYLYGTTFHYITVLGKYMTQITRLGGLLLLLVGLLLVIGQFGMLNSWISNLFGDYGYNELVQYM